MKRLSIPHWLKNKKGFTLVEVMVAIAVITVLMGAIVAIFTPVNEIVRSVQRDTMSDIVAVELGDYIEARLNKANEIRLYETDDTSKTVDKLNPDPLNPNPIIFEDTTSTSATKIVGVIVVDNNTGELYEYIVTRKTASSPLYYSNIIASDALDVETIIEPPANPGDPDYSVFPTNFYNNKEYRMSFKTISGQNNFVNIKTEIYDPKKGEKVSADRDKHFFLLNHYSTIVNKLSNPQPTPPPAYTVIVYTRDII